MQTTTDTSTRHGEFAQEQRRQQEEQMPSRLAITKSGKFNFPLFKKTTLL